MLIEKRNITDLHPAPYNPRVELNPGDPAWDKLKRSLDQFELVQPIVWNQRTQHVVSGHQRLKVLQARGLQSVDCVVVDLSLEDEKALNVTLNNAEVASDWDPAKLVEVVADLQELPDYDATLTGFDDQQLRDLLLTPSWTPPVDTDEVPETDDNVVRAMIEIPEDHWESAQKLLDAVLQSDSRIRLHVQQ